MTLPCRANSAMQLGLVCSKIAHDHSDVDRAAPTLSTTIFGMDARLESMSPKPRASSPTLHSQAMLTIPWLNMELLCLDFLMP